VILRVDYMVRPDLSRIGTRSSSAEHRLEGKTPLTAAIRATFDRGDTAIPVDPPLALSDAFAGDADKQAQWRAFLRRRQLDNALASLADVTERLAAFLLPPAVAAASGGVFHRRWGRGGGGRGEGEARPFMTRCCANNLDLVPGQL
jgi:hypothetical protein